MSSDNHVPDANRNVPDRSLEEQRCPRGGQPLRVAEEMGLYLDCRYYHGDRPCDPSSESQQEEVASLLPGVGPGREQLRPAGARPLLQRSSAHLICSSCGRYDPMGSRVLVIKLGALGDVIRTEVILRAIKARLPRSHITWVTRPSASKMLANNPLIDRLLAFNFEATYCLGHEKFDLCLSLDKDPAPAALAMRVQCPDKRGIGLSEWGTPLPLNPECAEYFALGLSNELKFRKNRKSYSQLICEAVGLEYDGRPYRLYPGPHNRGRAEQLFESLNVPSDEKVIGLNVGAGNVFANKTWRTRRFVQLAERLIHRGDCVVALLGGPAEAARHRLMLRKLGRAVLDTGCHNSPLDFAAIVERCDVVVTGDTTALHVAVAMGVPVVALFGPTCPQEIELFSRGDKIVSPAPCGPCYLRRCQKTPNCMDLIPVEAVERRVLQWATLARAARTECALDESAVAPGGRLPQAAATGARGLLAEAAVTSSPTVV